MTTEEYRAFCERLRAPLRLGVWSPTDASWRGGDHGARSVSEGRRLVTSALAALKGCHLRFFAYPHASGRLCLVCIEQSDGTDALQQLVELGEPIPDIYDEHRIESPVFCRARRRCPAMIGRIPDVPEQAGQVSADYAGIRSMIRMIARVELTF